MPPSERVVVLSRFQAGPLLEARRQHREQARVSPDLGLSQVTVLLSAAGVEFPGGMPVGWPQLRRIAKSTNGCFLLEPDGPWKIQIFSEETQRPCSLMPTAGAPTALVAGFTMHRIQGVTPEQDTRRKLEALGAPRGAVLDTNTGLGYTAIAAARTAPRVLTVELDPAMLELARFNPWSRELFENPRIERRIGDSFRLAGELEPASFLTVIHDPPTFSLAGELYSLEFYRRLHRVLAPGGRLFHYAGNPESGAGGRTTRRVVKGLKEAGFETVRMAAEAFGVTAVRS